MYEMKQWLEEIFFKKFNDNHFKMGYFIKLYGKDVYNKIVDLTNFLSDNVKLSERIYCILNDIKEISKCPMCGKIVKFREFGKGYKTYCSVKCACNDQKVKIKRKQTNIKIFGVENPFQSEEIKIKIRKTNEKIYGTPSPSQNENVKNKRKLTNMKNLGVDNPAKAPIVKEKTKETNNRIYGTDCSLQNKEVKEKIKISCNKIYGVDNPAKSDFIKNKTKDSVYNKYNNRYFRQKHYSDEQLEIINNPERLKEIYQEHLENEIPVEQLSLKYGFSPTLLGKHFNKHGLIPKRFSVSYQEKILKIFLDTLEIDYIQNTKRIIKRKELDFYIPEYKLGIEVNGVYWHDEHSKYGPFNLLNKHNLCKEKGIKLLHFWDIEVENKFEMIKSIIKGQLHLNENIESTLCKIIEVDFNLSYGFYENNHILGGIYCDYNYGLYYEDKLVSCIGINKVEEGYEIVRDCTKIGYNVTRRLEKLLSHIKNIHKDSPIYLILDKRLCQIEDYIYNTFQLFQETLPNFYCYSGNKLFEKNVEVEGNRRVFDCGEYILKYKE